MANVPKWLRKVWLRNENSNPTPGGQSGRSNRFVGAYSHSGKRNRCMQNPSGKRNRLAWKLQSGGPTATLQETTTRADDDHIGNRCRFFNGRSSSFGGTLHPIRPTPHLNCPTSQPCLVHIFLHHSSEKEASQVAYQTLLATSL